MAGTHCLATLAGARDMAQSIDHRFFAQCLKAAPIILYVSKGVAIDHYLFAHYVQVAHRTVCGSISSAITTICKCHFTLIAYARNTVNNITSRQTWTTLHGRRYCAVLAGQEIYLRAPNDSSHIVANHLLCHTQKHTASLVSASNDSSHIASNHLTPSTEIHKRQHVNHAAINLSPSRFFGDSHHDVTVLVSGDTTMQRATVPNPTTVIECSQHLVSLQTAPASRSELNAEQHARWPHYNDADNALRLCFGVEKETMTITCLQGPVPESVIVVAISFACVSHRSSQ